MTIPGFDVLNPTSYAPAVQQPSSSSTPSSSSSASSTNSSSGLNPYQQQLASLEQWQSQSLQESLFGETGDASNALYASAGLSADQFANLAAELQSLQASGTTGGIVDTSA